MASGLLGVEMFVAVAITVARQVTNIVTYVLTPVILVIGIKPIVTVQLGLGGRACWVV